MPASRRSAPVRFGSIGASPPMALAGERIGLLGGSFNPPHAAHVLISRIAAARLGLDRVWWIVSPGNPLKSSAELAPLAERMTTARALVRGSGTRIVVTDFEAHLPSAYTAATLAYLRRRFPAVRFVWLMGADNLAGFHRWQHWQDIAASLPIAVVDRPHWHLKAAASRAALALATVRLPEARARELADLAPPKWTLLTGPLSPLSSTALRARGMWPTGHT
jgi:nicotinate-nucleotide adenylyltransferase